MKHRFLSLILIILAALNITGLSTNGRVLGASTENFSVEPYVKTYPTVVTKTAFSQKEVAEYEPIPFEITYQNDPDSEYGTETITSEGTNGEKTLTYLVTYWGQEVIDKQLTDTQTEDPVSQKVARGTKIVWKTLQTPDEGEIKYWHKMVVWATKYDHTCPGCNYTTAVGAYLRKGVCATDPEVIPLWTSFYIPGYGKCTALDVGGAIRGNRIDMAYENASKAAWGAGWKEIYLINNAPY